MSPAEIAFTLWMVLFGIGLGVMLGAGFAAYATRRGLIWYTTGVAFVMVGLIGATVVVA